MAEKKKVCKECGHLTLEKICPFCKSTQLLEKYKGTVYVLNAKESEVAQRLNLKDNGDYALKY